MKTFNSCKIYSSFMETNIDMYTFLFNLILFGCPCMYFNDLSNSDKIIQPMVITSTISHENKTKYQVK